MKRVECIRVVLYVTTEPGKRERTEQEILNRLMPWFSDSLTPPYGPGTLVQFEVEPETALVIEHDPKIKSHGVSIGKYV